MNGRDRLGVILCAPLELPIAANCPRTKSDGVMSRSEFPRALVCIAFYELIQLNVQFFCTQRIDPT